MIKWPSLFHVTVAGDEVKIVEGNHLNKATFEVKPDSSGPIAFYQIHYPDSVFDRKVYDACIPYIYEHKQANGFVGVLRECRNYNNTREWATRKPVIYDEDGQTQKGMFE